AGPATDGEALVPRLSIVLPCHNEAANVAPLYQKLVHACRGISHEILFIDDGSEDGTADQVDRLRRLDPAVRLLRFVRNAGHQHALRAGYRAARGDYVLTMDADLQHPAELVPAMLARALEGFDVVQAVREGDQKGFFKDWASRAFYKVFNSLSDVPLVAQASDFRLVSRYVCDILNALPERNLVVRAILPWLGFRASTMAYPLGERLHGRPAYTFRKSFDLGAQALFEFSAFPLKLAMRLGFVISILAFGYGLFNVAAKFLTDRNVPGYTDLIASTLFLGGLILVYLGILGRYILVIVDHLKRRPEYLAVEETPPHPAAYDPLRSREARARAPHSRPEGRRAP
ncbi:MAG TPA: glycosyltransferase family 2 protein, partial [Fibrobacteria bacterium]|nr:glycosyltransferase family 2 protein [Fibrobacteria bacterium]